MTKEKALYQFFNQFGIPAYVNTSVPDTASMPYLTYDVLTSQFGDSPVSLTVNVYYYTESESAPNAKVRDIEAVIDRGGVLVPCDDGVIWLMRGVPWCQAIVEDDQNIKRRYLNVTAEYFTY